MKHMKKPLKCAPSPCSTCPYARSTPPGVWDASEYRKLPEFDTDDAMKALRLGAFLCHSGEGEFVCRGWISVHADTLAVRFGMMSGLILPCYVPNEPEPDLYASGAEACAAGLKGVPRPSIDARLAVQKINRQRRKKGSHGKHGARDAAQEPRNRARGGEGKA